MDFLELFNAVAEKARPIHTQYTPVPDMTSTIMDYGMDSLDMLMTTVYLCELHGIPEEVGKDLVATTVREFETFIKKHKTTEPESIQAAKDYIQ
jgi:acyl carrier protein